MSSDTLSAGVDEAGRGPLAGPVVAAAVIFSGGDTQLLVKDSKKLSESRREEMYEKIYDEALTVGIGTASVKEIDDLNILNASMLAMRRAVSVLNPQPLLVLCDGNRCPDVPMACQAIVGGDDKVASISAASIIAKVTRDRIMIGLHEQFPQYRFDLHKGYPTKVHRDALMTYGATEEHRRTFRPVKQAMAAHHDSRTRA